MAYTNINNTKEFRRNQLKATIDEFATFQWRGEESFEKYGMFIINDKNGNLKFYNGPGFSNEYSKPQFDNAGGSLIGVTFNKQTISFSVGIYWFTEKEYRQIMNWLSPLVTSYIIFDFEPKYRYNVKLSKIGDSTRWIVGQNENGEKTYYTELSLSFEVQGAQCAIGVHSYELEESAFSYKIKTSTSEFIESDLPTPINFNIELALQQFSVTGGKKYPPDDNTTTKDCLILKAEYKKDGETEPETIILFSLDFINLTYEKPTETPKYLSLKYNSETGLVFISLGGEYKILTLQTTTDSGRRIISNYSVNKFVLPGLFNYSNFNYNNLEFKWIWTRNFMETTPHTSPVPRNHLTKFQIECYPRTNII